MVKNPSRFSGSTGLRQNIVRNAAPKLPPPGGEKDYADPSVEIPQGLLDADAFDTPNDIISDDSLMSVAPADRPGYDEKIKNAETGGHWSTDTDDKDDVVDYRDNNRKGGIQNLFNNNSNTASTGSIFMDFANFWKDDEHKTIIHPDYKEGGDIDKFTTNWILADNKANAAAAADAAEDKRLAAIEALKNSAHTTNFNVFQIGGGTAINPNQVKFDALRKDTLTKDNKATGVMQNVDGKDVFQNWTQVAQNHGPNVKVNYGLYGDPMTPKPGQGPPGTMKINRSMSEQEHAAIQTTLNKQQANRDFTLTLKTWQSDYLLGPRDNASKVKAKAFIDAKKAEYLGWAQQGGHGIGGYGEMFGKELDKRYYNLFESSSAPGTKKLENRKLTVAEKLQKKLANGTITDNEKRRLAILTGATLGSNQSSPSGGADPTMGYSNFLGNSNSWY
jgi:hypothetical protein